MNINSQHPFFTTSTDMNEIANPIKKLGIGYFTYTKTYHSGARLYMGTHANTLENYIKKQGYLTGNVECKPDHYTSQTVMWETLPNQSIFNELARPMNIDHGMYMIEHHADYNEYFCFATERGNKSIVNTYLTHMELLKKFTQYFKEKAQPAIQLAENNKIILPFNNEKMDFSTNTNDATLLKNQLTSFKLMNSETLTDRQAECCSLLITGKTAKETAEILKLSPRTIEYYLNQIKIKLNCSNRSELMMKLAIMIK